jgi:peptidoglycan LD-endopeptidase CwlK|tara:strand:- start:144 stop:659 length:516 start_codon:yes stop_codon:yes gene_type:complete
MTFKLGKRSLERLEGVDERMVAVVKHAIGATKIDFGVICGLRTIEEQKALVAKGASQTMKSKHIDGIAVDLMAYIGSRASWELNLYDDIADAMKQGAEAVGVEVRWGAAWNVPNIANWKGTEHTFYPKNAQAEYTKIYKSSMEDAMNYYVDIRRDEGRRPFIDGPHFELMV